MKPFIIKLFSLILFISVQTAHAQNDNLFKKEFIVEIIERVNSYQLANPWTDTDYNWIRGTYYIGVMAC